MIVEFVKKLSAEFQLFARGKSIDIFPSWPVEFRSFHSMIIFRKAKREIYAHSDVFRIGLGCMHATSKQNQQCDVNEFPRRTISPLRIDIIP